METNKFTLEIIIIIIIIKSNLTNLSIRPCRLLFARKRLEFWYSILLVSGSNDNGFELVFGCLQAIFGAARRENTEEKKGIIEF